MKFKHTPDITKRIYNEIRPRIHEAMGNGLAARLDRTIGLKQRQLAYSIMDVILNKQTTFIIDDIHQTS